MLYIFDLDMTLVDSSSVETFRDKRRWSTVYRMIANGSVKAYPGILQILNALKNDGNKIAIVTSAPKKYALKVCEYINLEVDLVIGYHDTSLKKPYPDPINKAVEILGGKKSETYSFGDRVIDILASNRAGVNSVACLWGSNESEILIESSPNLILKDVSELNTLISKL